MTAVMESTTPNQSALDDLVRLLDLEAIEVNIFRGNSPDENRQRVFGGQVAGQALVAAARTIDERGRLVHSLHAYFLRPGDPTVPILYEVDRIRDGRSFSTRRVVAIQHGRAIFNLQASFHDDEPGPDHQLAMPDGMGDPLEFPDFRTRMAPYADQIGDWYDRPRPIDLRYVDGDPTSRRGQSTTKQHVWLRADGVLPEDPVLHACVVTYASDMTLLDTTLLPFGLDWDTPGVQMASVDHAMWFHRPFHRGRLVALCAVGGVDVVGARDGPRIDLHQRRSAGRQRGAGGPHPPDELSVDDRDRSGGVDRALLTAVVTITLVVAACGSDASSDSESFGRGQPDVPGSETTATTTEPTTEPPATATSVPGASESSTPAAPSAAPSPAGPLPEPTVALVEIGTTDQPVDAASRAGFGEVYVAEQPGRVIAVTDLSTEVVLDITDLTDAQGEQGLLGLAFHPTEALAYVNFTDRDGDTVVAEFAIDTTTGLFDRDSYREVLTVDQPYTNHNGGQLAFGPDQLLYIGVGDGGSGGDPQRHALDLGSRLGKILRIDPLPDGDQPFGVPADNPFVGDGAADPTIWAYGLRNPWRFSFDPVTGDLWIGDVGQGDFEEIDHSAATDRRDAAKGTNFGWSAFEGFERFNDDQSTDGATAPLFVYDHADGRCSVTGGTVARDDSAPDLAGWYLFGDYCTGQIWALDPTAPPSEPRVVEIAELGGLVAITSGPEAEVYAVSNGGTVARLIAD